MVYHRQPVHKRLKDCCVPVANGQGCHQTYPLAGRKEELRVSLSPATDLGSKFSSVSSSELVFQHSEKVTPAANRTENQPVSNSNTERLQGGH